MKRVISLAIIIGAAYLLVPKPQEETFVNVIDEVIPAVVEIHVQGTILEETFTGLQERRVGVLGSGVFIAQKGYILTCAHLFRDFKKIDLIEVETLFGEAVKADLIKVSPRDDLAIIQATYFNTNPAVKLADPRRLRLGQEVFAIGSPLGLSFSVTSGIISALNRDFEDNYNTTQSDTSINPGNSGGPLFNLRGELVGINVFFIPSTFMPVFSGLGFSVQSGQIIEFITDVKKTQKDLKI